MASPGPQHSPLGRFLGAVHRRYVAQRLLERTGLGVLGGSACAILLLPLLLWQDDPAVPVAIGALCFGGFLGFLWGVARRPTFLDAAMEADRQLDLQDLLGTAAVLHVNPRAGEPDPWAAAVLALADARCRSLRPRAVLLARLGARAWGGIGLSAAAVLAGALLAGSPSGTQAAGTRPGGAEDQNATTAPFTAPVEPAERPLLALAPGPLAPAVERDDPDADSTAGRSDDTRPPGTETGSDRAPTKRNEEGPANSYGSTASGTGSGSSQTHPPPQPATPPSDSARGPDKGTPPSQPGTATKVVRADGSGRPDDPAQAPPQPVPKAGGRAAAGRPGRVAPPWRTEAWAADVQRAHEALDAGQVPPAYEEMVRRYFDRP